MCLLHCDTLYYHHGRYSPLPEEGMPAFDKHTRCYSCRMHCKGEDPCASGAPLEACSSCSSLSEVEWNHLRTVFQERSAKRASKNVPADPEPDDGDPEAGEIDNSILDLNPEDSGTGYVSPTRVSAPAGLSPLQPASATSRSQFIQPSMPPPRSAAFHKVPPSTTSSVFFKTPAPVRSNIMQDPMFSSAPDPQRLVPPPTPRTQMLKAHFEQQNMQMMENLSQQNQKQMIDLSSQLQSGLQQFLTSSMEEMFKKFSPAPLDSTATFSSVQAQPSQVDQTQQVNQPVPNPPEPMDTSFPHNTIKKGLKGVKGSASIAPSTIKAIVSPPPPPTTQPQPQTESPLQRLEKGDYGVETGSSYSAASQIEDSEPENLAPPPKADFHAFIDRVRQYLGIDDPAKTGLQTWLRTRPRPKHVPHGAILSSTVSETSPNG